MKMNQIKIVVADITTLKVDAIVNAATKARLSSAAARNPTLSTINKKSPRNREGIFFRVGRSPCNSWW